jgi:hypothetical protein
MRCVICPSVEIAVQQRFGPQGWSETQAYLLQHYRDPNGR